MTTETDSRGDRGSERDEGRVRDLPQWARVGSVLVRAGHLIGCAVIVGALVAAARPSAIGFWWALTAGTGALLVAYEWAAHPDQWRQLSGWATLFKLALLAIAAAVPSTAIALLLVAMVTSVLGAHLPRRWRHLRLF